MCSKSIRKEEIETEFEDMLAKLKPRPNITKVVKHELLVLWQDRIFDVEKVKQQRQDKIEEADSQIKQCVDKIKITNSTTVMRALEQDIEELEARKLQLGEKVEKTKDRTYDFEDALNRVFGFLKNPLKMWKDGDLQQKRLVLRMVFEEPLVYERGIGFCTATFTLPVAVSCVPELDKDWLVEMPGIEPGSNVYC